VNRRRDLGPGDPVELFSRFNGAWVAGFEIELITTDGYQVRRTSDHTLLPVVTSAADLRPAN
jgi:hypothetical protein